MRHAFAMGTKMLDSSISPTAAQAQSYSSITITQSEEVTSTSLEEIKYSKVDKNDNIPGSSNYDCACLKLT